MKRFLQFAWMLLLGIQLSGCAAVKLGSIAKPVETSQLRVVVLPISSHHSRGSWGKSSEEFSDTLYRIVHRHLDRFGFYQVVPEADVRAVLGDYVPQSWSLNRNDAELVRRIGAALYADYVLLVERGSLGDPHYFLTVDLFNIDSGRRFEVRINNTREPDGKKLPDGTAKLALRELFRDAKGDLLSTALNKVRKAPEIESQQRPERDEAEQMGLEKERAHTEEAERLEREQLARIKADEQKFAKAGVLAGGERSVDYSQILQAQERLYPGAKRLIVYDMAPSSETYRTVALILSEALREEIHKRGSYNLVNRENLQQLLDEMKFQQSGLVESSQAIKLGQGAGAQEIVTGTVGAVGRTVIMQSKRIDIQTMVNRALASIRSEEGKEDQMLNGLAHMVDQLLQPEN